MGLRFQAVIALAITWTSHYKASRINKVAWLHMEAHFLLARPSRIRKRNQWDIRQPRKNIYTAKNVREHFSAFSSPLGDLMHQGPGGEPPYSRPCTMPHSATSQIIWIGGWTICASANVHKRLCQVFRSVLPESASKLPAEERSFKRAKNTYPDQKICQQTLSPWSRRF